MKPKPRKATKPVRKPVSRAKTTTAESRPTNAEMQEWERKAVGN